MTETLGGGGGKWGLVGVACKDQIPYMGREKRSMDEATLEEEIGDNIWQGVRSRNFKEMRYGRACF